MSSVTQLRLKPPGPVVGLGFKCLRRESLDGWAGVGGEAFGWQTSENTKTSLFPSTRPLDSKTHFISGMWAKTYLSLICRAQFWLQWFPPERHSSTLPYWQQFSQNWSPSTFTGSFSLKGIPVFSEKTRRWKEEKKKHLKTMTEIVAKYI